VRLGSSKTNQNLRGHIMRVPVVAAILVLGLSCGSAGARQLWLPTVDNPFCPIKTYMLPELAEHALSAIDRDKQPVIVVSARAMVEEMAYGRFLMAHECCHHTLGHVGSNRQELGHIGPQRFFYLAPQLRRMELDADCCAAKLLAAKRELAPIAAARETMSRFGTNPTGAHYPTGIERAVNIARCASEE
jgi:hypothetical protein